MKAQDPILVSMLMLTMVASGVNAKSPSPKSIGDTNADVIVPSPPASSVVLSGLLMEGYRVLPHDMVIHGELEHKQRYLYLHLKRPIDVISDHPPHYSVFHQYDIQAVGAPLDQAKSLIGHLVIITGSMPAPGGIVGGPDWEPFPLTISARKIREGTPRVK